MSFIALYVRISTTGQNEEGQKREIQKWLDGNGIDQSKVRWFIDKKTGENLDRPEFQKLQKLIFEGVVKTVVIWKLDRLSRSLRDGINTLVDWLEKGVRLVSITQQLDFSGATGKLVAAVLFAVSQMETELRRERQAAGIEAAKERGVYKGRAKGAVKLGVDPERAVELRTKGLKNKEIAKAMGVSISSVKRYLQQAG